MKDLRHKGLMEGPIDSTSPVEESAEHASPKKISPQSTVPASERVCASKKKTIKHRFGKYFSFIFTKGNFDESPWSMFVGHRQLRSLFRRPLLRPLLAKHPEIIYRIYRRYMAASLSTKSRRAILREHYNCLLENADELFFHEILSRRPILWQKTIGTDIFAIRLCFNAEWHQEGDFTLEFLDNSKPLYNISFSIAPGNLVGSQVPRTAFVGRVQGVPWQFSEIRRATKTCLDLAPSLLLVAAIEGVAGALKIDLLAGVRSHEQITIYMEGEQDIYFDYDAFWQKYPATVSARAYLIAVPIPEKSLELISTRHRGRTRSKRTFKREIAETVKISFSQLLAGQYREYPPPAETSAP